MNASDAVRKKGWAVVALIALLAILTVGGKSPLMLAQCLVAAGGVAGFYAWMKRARGIRKPSACPVPLAVLSQTQLSKDCRAALLEADGGQFLVVFGEGFAQVVPAPARTAVKAALSGSAVASPSLFSSRSLQ